MLRRCRLIRVRPSNPAAGLFEIEQRPVFEDRLLGYALEVFGLFGRKESSVFRWESVKRFGEETVLIEGAPELRAPGAGRKRR